MIASFAHETMLGWMRRVAARFDRLTGVGIEETLFYERRRDGGRPPVVPASGIRIQRFESSGSEGLSDAPFLNRAMIQERFDNGDLCYAAWLDDRLAHYSWVRSGGIQPVPEAGFSVPVGPREFWIYHCWTAPEARGKRIYPSVLARIAEDQFAAGRALARIYTSRRNIASQHGIARAGFRLVFNRRALRLGSRYWKMGGDIPASRQNQ